jgi:hypothetical protein
MRRLTTYCVLFAAATLASAQTKPVELQVQANLPFRFVAYGDTRFTDPTDTDASNPVVRKALVQAIADAHPAFISIGGDLVYGGANKNDWRVFDTETAPWTQNKIPVYPALGNHELYGNEKIALENYFQRFPQLQNRRYYSVRAANTLMLMLDSSLDETSGPQGQWLVHELDTLSSDVDFVCPVLHHPPFTDSSEHFLSGGHSARPSEQALASLLEKRQAGTHARFVVIAGHVHNYEHHEHGGVTYFVTGGGGAHPYLIPRKAGDPFVDKPVNYHYLLVEVDRGKMKISMNRVELTSGKPNWTMPDVVEISAPVIMPVTAGK